MVPAVIMVSAVTMGSIVTVVTVITVPLEHAGRVSARACYFAVARAAYVAVSRSLGGTGVPAVTL